MYAAAGGYDPIPISAGGYDPMYTSAGMNPMYTSAMAAEGMYSSAAGMEPMYASALAAEEEDMMAAGYGYGDGYGDAPFSARGERHDPYVSDLAGRGYGERQGMYDPIRNAFTADPMLHSSGLGRELEDNEYLGMDPLRADGQMRGIYLDDYERIGTSLTEGFADGRMPEAYADGEALERELALRRNRPGGFSR